MVSDPYNQQILQIDADEGSTFKMPTCNMSSVRDLNDLVRLDIGGNDLAEVNLEPIQHMTTIRYLDFSENKLQSIDLASLQEFKNLETLDLSYNCLKTLDLTPLMECENLRFLYVHTNQLETVNITPLMHLEHLESVMITTPTEEIPNPVYASALNNKRTSFLEPIQASFLKIERPGWLKCHRDIKKIQCHPEPYKTLVKAYGWKDVKEHLISLLKIIKSKSDFHAQNVFLRSLGLPELACYDGSISDIIDLLPTEGSYAEGVGQIRERLIALLYDQLENGGSTLFFDIEKLSTTPGSVLIPLIVSRRTKELKEITLYDYNGKVNLMPLWLTGFGFNLLLVQECRKKEDRILLSEKVYPPFTKLGIEIPVKKTSSKKKHDSLGSSPSRPILDYVLSQVG